MLYVLPDSYLKKLESQDVVASKRWASYWNYWRKKSESRLITEWPERHMLREVM